MRSKIEIAALLTLLTAASAAAVAAAAPGTLESARADIRLKRFEAGLSTLKRLAQNGDSDSQYLFGMAALNGLAREPDEPEARRYLTLAADKGHAAAAFVLASLLERDTPADAARIRDLLQRAAQGGNAAAQQAIQRGGSILASDHESAVRDSHTRNELVLWAARHDEPELISRLLPTADVQDDFGTSALGYAALAGSYNSIARLLQQGARADSRNRYGVTPLMQAVGAKQLKAADQLLSAGADVAAVDAAGNTPLIYAARAKSAEAV
jgi:ankyrin repeat protein